MDPITLNLRVGRTPAASAPTGGELSAAEIDANFSNLKTAAEQLDAEKLSIAALATPGRITSLLATDDFIIYRGGLPYLVAASVVEAGVPAATAPAAFTAGQWTAAATSTPGEISFDLTALPSDGGSAITALEYRVNTGSAIAFTGTGTGVRVVTAGLTAGVAVDLQVRAVNAVGAGAWSDIKNRTPLASGGGGTYEIAGSGQSVPGGGDPRTAPVPAGAATGDRLLIMFRSSEAVTSVTDDAGTSWSALTIPEATAEDKVYISAPLGGSIPTTITMDLAASAYLEKATVYVLTGASATLVDSGALSTGWSTDPRSHAYVTAGANEFVFGLINFTGGGVTGAGSADGSHTWQLLSASGYLHTFATVRAAAGSYGATLAPTGAGSPSDGFWFSLAAA